MLKVTEVVNFLLNSWYSTKSISLEEERQDQQEGRCCCCKSCRRRRSFQLEKNILVSTPATSQPILIWKHLACIFAFYFRKNKPMIEKCICKPNLRLLYWVFFVLQYNFCWNTYVHSSHFVNIAIFILFTFWACFELSAKQMQ